MFDSRHVLDPLHISEQAAALVKVYPKGLLRFARTGLVAGLHVASSGVSEHRISMAGRRTRSRPLSTLTRTAVLCS